MHIFTPFVLFVFFVDMKYLTNKSAKVFYNLSKTYKSYTNSRPEPASCSASQDSIFDTCSGVR